MRLFSTTAQGFGRYNYSLKKSLCESLYRQELYQNGR